MMLDTVISQVLVAWCPLLAEVFLRVAAEELEGERVGAGREYDIRVTSACAIFFLLAEALNRQVHSSALVVRVVQRETHPCSELSCVSGTVG